MCVIGRWSDFKAAWQHSLSPACLHCSVESAFLCLIFPWHSTKSSELLAVCPTKFTPTSLLHPFTYTYTQAYFCTHNCTLHLAIKTRHDPAGTEAPTGRTSLGKRREKGKKTEGSHALQHRRRAGDSASQNFHPSLALPPTDSGGYPDARMSVRAAPVSD